MTTSKEAIDRLIECARLLGTTQAKKGAGTYTQQDSRSESAMYESIAAHRKALEAALAKQEQGEPVAWMRTSGTGSPVVTEELLVEMPEMRWNFQQPLYTTPQQRTAAEGEDIRRAWVGLNAKELYEIDDQIREKGSATIAEIYQAIEAKLKAKNERKEKNTRNGGCL